MYTDRKRIAELKRKILNLQEENIFLRDECDRYKNMVSELQLINKDQTDASMKAVKEYRDAVNRLNEKSNEFHVLISDIKKLKVEKTSEVDFLLNKLRKKL